MYNTELVLDAITISVHNKFNWITINFDRTQHGISSIQNFIIL